MKRFSKILSTSVALCLISSFSFSFLPSVNISSSANEPEEEMLQYASDPLASPAPSSVSTLYLDNFATHYFSNLITNTAYNKADSCGYVAISCLLSFYDTFLNDNIIPEAYDQTSTSLTVSPGVKDESIFSSLSMEDYYNLFSQNDYNNVYVNTYFQFLLFKLIQEKGEETGQNYIYLYEDDTKISLGVNYDKMLLILNTYLFDYLEFTDDECQLITNDGTNGEEEVKDFAIDYIKQGYPVIVGIPGHVTVAYDYNEATDTVYGYWGHRSSKMHHAYTQFSDAYAIVLDIPHVHSDNYILDGTETCYCDLDYHVHDYTYRYEQFKAFAHKSFCWCGDFILEDHLYFASDVHVTPQGDVYANCAYCRYYIDLPDTYIPVIINRIPGSPEELVEYAQEKKAEEIT